MQVTHIELGEKGNPAAVLAGASAALLTAAKTIDTMQKAKDSSEKSFWKTLVSSGKLSQKKLETLYESLVYLGVEIHELQQQEEIPAVPSPALGKKLEAVIKNAAEVNKDIYILLQGNQKSNQKSRLVEIKLIDLLESVKTSFIEENLCHEIAYQAERKGSSPSR